MTRERLITVLVLSAIGLAVMGVLRPASPDPQDDLRTAKTRFFLEKTHQDKRFDVVIVGDSRALRGISPADMERTMPGMRIFNFAFHAGGFNPEIFAAAEELLDPESRTRTIVLAPTPLSFMPWKQNNAQFREYREKPVDEVLLYKRFYPLSEFFQPVRPDLFARKLLHLEPVKILNEDYLDNGWIATNQSPYDRYADLTALSEMLAGNRADNDVQEDLFKQVNAWRQEGVRVFCTFVPAYAPREAMEDSMLLFDRDEFIQHLEVAGGEFVSVSGIVPETYDGSHLVETSARQFSLALGQMIHARIELSRGPGEKQFDGAQSVARR